MQYRRIRFGQITDSKVIEFAVHELCRYLKRMDSALQIEVLLCQHVTCDNADLIWVGLDNALIDTLPDVEDKAFDDAFSIQIKNNQGIITGVNERSVLIAVYRFLKELGCRWFRPGGEGEYIPKRIVENISLSIAEEADYRHRGICIEGANTYENVFDMIDYLPKIGMNEYFIQFRTPARFFSRWYTTPRNPYQERLAVTNQEIEMMTVSLEKEVKRRGLVYHKTGHGWTCEPLGIEGVDWKPIPQLEAEDDRRQFFAKIGGQRGLWKSVPLNSNLCYSKESVQDLISNAVIEYCQENPQIDVIHLWLADGFNNHCECAACQEKRPSDWYIILLNEVDRRLSAAGISVRIVFLVYFDLLWAPITERLENPDRFVLMFAPVTRVYGDSFPKKLECENLIPPYLRNKLHMPETLEENLAHLKEWQRVFSGDSFLFDYHLMWAHVVDPGYEYCAKNICEDIKNLRHMKLNGMVSCQVQRCGFPTNLPLYMMGNVLWNTKSCYEDVAQEYYRAAYGDAGEKVHSYLSDVSDLLLVYHSVAHGAPVFAQKPFCKNYNKLFDRVNDFLSFAQKEQEHHPCSEWKVLIIHAEYVLRFATCLGYLESNNTEKLLEEGGELLDFVNINEPSLQKILDGFNTHRILYKRLGLECIDKNGQL